MRTFAALLLALLTASALAQPAKQNLKPFAFAREDVPPASCTFPAPIPANATVLAAGEYGGRPTGFQIDQSGHEARQIDVAVNATRKPVVLMLGAYEPTVWNIGWSRGTRIVGVFVSGYHRQAVAGLPRGTPVLNSSYDNRGPCGYFYVKSLERDALDLVALRALRRPVDQVFLSSKGRVVVGDRLDERTRLLTSGDVTPDSLRPKNAPLAGPMGIEEAVSQGILRAATQDDILKWDTARQIPADAETQPVGGPREVKRRNMSNAYVVLKPFKVPAGLYGAHAAAFFVPQGVPLPTGELGHSTLLDFNSMTCRGSLCASADPRTAPVREAVRAANAVK